MWTWNIFQKQKKWLKLHAHGSPYWLLTSSWTFYENNVITKLERSSVWERCIAFMLQFPSGWRCTVRALQGWMVEVIRQLCDVSFGCLARRAPRGPSPPHLLIPSRNTCGQTTSDEELVAVDHKKNIRAMSHKEKGKWENSEWKWGKRRHWDQIGEQVRKEWERKTRIRTNSASNKAKRGRERVREIVCFGRNGSYAAPAVTIKQQVDAIIRPGE